MKSLIETIDKFETLIAEKEATIAIRDKNIQEINYNFPGDVKIPDYEKTKTAIIELLEVYGCLGITQLSQLTTIEGPLLLIILKRMKDDTESIIQLNKDYEWCLK
jgi:hypothetical protein